MNTATLVCMLRRKGLCDDVIHHILKFCTVKCCVCLDYCVVKQQHTSRVYCSLECYSHI